MATNSAEYSRRYRAAHPEAMRVQRRRTYLVQKGRDPEDYNARATARQREWRAANHERSRANNRASYARHRGERVAEKRLYAEAHPDLVRANNSLQKARRREALIGDPGSARAYVAVLLNDICVYCGGIDDLEIDHIVPIASGGPHHWSNLTVACGLCNRSKHAAGLLEFLCRSHVQ